MRWLRESKTMAELRQIADDNVLIGLFFICGGFIAMGCGQLWLALGGLLGAVFCAGRAFGSYRRGWEVKK